MDPLARQKPLVDRGLMSELLHKLNSDLPSGIISFHFILFILRYFILVDYGDFIDFIYFLPWLMVIVL